MGGDADRSAGHGGGASLEAAEWHARLSGAHVTTDDLTQFEAWLADSDNARAWREVSDVWKNAAALAEDPEIVTLTRSAVRRSHQQPARKSARILTASGLAAALLSFGGAAWAFWPVTVETPDDQGRRIEFQDATVSMSQASALRYRRIDRGRKLHLLKGGVDLSVTAHEAARHEISAGPITLTAMDGELSMVRRDRFVAVTVAAGQAVVDDTRHGRVSLRSGSTLSRSDETSTVAVAVAPGRRDPIIFRSTPLSEVAAILSQHTAATVDVQGSARSREISGVYDPTNPEDFLSLLTALPGLMVERSGDGIRIRQKS